MTKNQGTISPKKRYVLRMLDMSKNDPQLKGIIPDPAVKTDICKEGLTLDRMIDTALTGYKNRPALGERAYKIVQEEGNGKWIREYLPKYDTITYTELQFRIKALANAWRYHPVHKVAPKEFVAILGFTGTDFSTLDLTCAYALSVTIPLQSSTSGADLNEIFENTNPAALASTINDLPVAVDHAITHGGFRSLIVFDYEEKAEEERQLVEAAQAKLKQSGVKTELITLKELIAFGSNYQFDFLPPSDEGDRRMMGIIHSSGSTGKPKGAIMPESAVRSLWRGNRTQVATVAMGFAPLNHLIGRNGLTGTLCLGGTLYFTLKPDMSTLFEDIRLVRPTQMNFFPRILELIYQHFQGEVTQRVRKGEGDEVTISELVKIEMSKTFLGDRLAMGSVGGAPTSPAVMKFIKDCFDILIIDGYGNTESGTGGVAMNGVINRAIITDYKLRDVPELGYYLTDKPYPRGELLFKSTVGISGYYKQPEATAGLFDKDGFSITGDIVEERGPDQVVIIDRRKDVMKLSNGEFVAVGQLGTVFEAESAVIKQTYLYGNSFRSYLLGVIVPDMKVVQSLIGDHPTESALINLIRNELQQVAKNKELRSFEVPRSFLIEKEEFSQANGLLSSVRKRLRPALKRKYSKRLEALYIEQEEQQEADIEALKDPNSPLNTLEKLIKLLEVNLKIQDIDSSKSFTYSELGGDSLGAVSLSMSIGKVFGVTIPANTILSPTSNPPKWANILDKTLAGGNNRPTFAKIHGKGATILHKKDLILNHFIDDTTLNSTSTLEDATQSIGTVLLTGANGYLGHILCIEWLQQLAATNGQLICIIRAKDDAAAKSRLNEVFKGVDPDLEFLYNSLAAKHLQVWAGDITESNFGLTQKQYHLLTTKVDRICHPAALVNHRLGYEHLFGPNVVGTAEVIKLALSNRKKVIDFVSTVAVERFLNRKKGNTEASPLLESVTLSNQYAAGYGSSKWAAECLLQQAHQKYGVSINTFRGDMMLAHQTYKGQINVADMFTRLLFSIIRTGLAPESFYQLNADGSKAKAHYDGSPSDVIAAAIIGVHKIAHDGYQTFNIKNYHQEDGVSLDSVVNWIETAGYPIKRVSDHKKWLTQFKEKLSALPEAQRQHSALDLLAAYSRPYPPNLAVADCTNYKNLVNKLKGKAEVPELSEAYIHKCLEDMRLLGLL